MEVDEGPRLDQTAPSPEVVKLVSTPETDC